MLWKVHKLNGNLSVGLKYFTFPWLTKAIWALKNLFFSFAVLSKLERQDWLGFSQALSLHYHCWCYPFLSHWSPHLSLMACFFLWPWPPYMVTRCLKEPYCWSQNRLVGYQTLLSQGCALTESSCHRWVKCIWASWCNFVIVSESFSELCALDFWDLVSS